jgi:hypothetical protein
MGGRTAPHHRFHRELTENARLFLPAPNDPAVGSGSSGFVTRNLHRARPFGYLRHVRTVRSSPILVLSSAPLDRAGRSGYS